MTKKTIRVEIEFFLVLTNFFGVETENFQLLDQLWKLNHGPLDG
jgi:hypothetical protein